MNTIVMSMKIGFCYPTGLLPTSRSFGTNSGYRNQAAAYRCELDVMKQGTGGLGVRPVPFGWVCGEKS